jgi:hypothetical protein
MQSQRYTLIIKGSPVAALKALEQHGIQGEVRPLVGNWRESRSVVDCDLLTLQGWFNENLGLQAPFADGALLLFTEGSR